MSLLTDDDKLGIAETVVHMDFTESFTNCIDRVCELAEAAVIARLATVSVEPVGYVLGCESLDFSVIRTKGFYPAEHEVAVHTATQLAAARVQAREEAANHLRDLVLKHPGNAAETALQCEAEIRALIGGSN